MLNFCRIAPSSSSPTVWEVSLSRRSAQTPQFWGLRDRITRTGQTLLSSNESNKLGDKAVSNATGGILFMGTPHDGSPLANWGSFFASLLGIWHPVNPSFLKELSKDND
jgi:hypothetical protein